MSLSSEETRNISEILVELYGDDFRSRVPTEQTAERLEFLFEEIKKCNKKIETLFRSLPCGVYARGWFKRCSNSIGKIVRENRKEFQLCSQIRTWQLRTIIAESCR